MKRSALTLFALLLVLSCKKDNDADFIQQDSGTVWLSGGLINCSAQIRLDGGNILVVNQGTISSLKSDDRVNVTYKKTSINEFCSPAIDCEVIEIKKVE